jgi:acetyltransferase-like isoleucine patch superfamily enzyme
MEISTIIRLLEMPPGGLQAVLFPSGAIVYFEPDNSLYYAGGNDGNSRATFVMLINNSSFGGTVTSVNVTSKALTITNVPITRSGTIGIELKPSGVLQGTYGSSSQIPIIAVDTFGRLTNVTLAPISIGSGTVKSITITSSTLNVTGSPVTTTGTITVDLPLSNVIPGSYGSASNIPVLTVDAYGRITNATTVTIAGGNDPGGNGLTVIHDFTLIGNGTADSPLGLSLNSQMLKDNVTNQLYNANIIIGADSQYAPSVSARNISIGTSNLIRLDSSTEALNDNVAIGNFAMQNSTKSNKNVAIGPYAINTANTSGSDNNVAIGYKALNYVAAPASNVVIGNDAQNSSSYTLSKNNVVIGNTVSAGTSNNVIIGNSCNNKLQADYGSVCIGDTSTVGTNAVAIGSKVSASTNAVCMGLNSNAVNGGVAIGSGSVVSASTFLNSGGVSVGVGASSNDSSVAVGSYADSHSSSYGVAIGHKASVGFDYSIAIGSEATASDQYQLSIGSMTYKIGKPDGTGVETSATAGSASALPATPSGYLRVSINGTAYKIPLYDI